MSLVLTRCVHRWLLLTLLAGLPAIPVNASGQHVTHTLEQGDRRLELLISKQFEPDMQAILLQWVEYISDALAGIYGHWPRQYWQIRVVAAPAPGSGPVHFGRVQRGEIDRVEFFTVARASLDELKRNWTGYHELAHLLIPYRGWGDAWFSEGLASYYQNILQARMGVLSEQAMWQKLYDGFQRGLAQTRFDGQPLRSVSRNMRSNGAFMRVYWSGAWYFLMADSRLRMQSGGRMNLDRLLEKLNDCCAEERLSVPQIVARLDEFSDGVLFSTLYKQVAASTRVPAFDSIFAELGIGVVEGRVRLHAGPAYALRRQMVVDPAL